MGISFGSTDIKPYAGSKEVQEAYVGSQLVYSAAPPYNYYFVGGETKYFISPNVVLPNYNATIAKKNGTGNYMIAISKSYNRLKLTDTSRFLGWKLKFTASNNVNYGTRLRAELYLSDRYNSVELGVISKTEKLITMTVEAVSGNAPIYIQIYSDSDATFYLDNIRFEEA